MSDYSGWGQYTRDSQQQGAGYAVQQQSSPYWNKYWSPSDPYGPGFDAPLDPSQVWGFNQALGAGQIQAGPQLAMNQNTREQLANQVSAQQASLLAQTGFLNQDYQTGLAKLDNQSAGIDVQRQALARQPGYLSTLHDLANQSYQQSADVARRGLDSEATARGAFTSIGVNQGRSDIVTQLTNQLQRSDTQYNEQIASLADQNKMLDLQANNLGLDRQALKTELERGLDRLNLNSIMSIGDLLTKLNSTNIEDQMIAQQIFNSALGASDYYSQFYPSNTPLQDIYGPTDTSGNITQTKNGGPQ